jgi:translation initiation factor 2 beta subunit (eIF-2beta)/eIF-5
MAYNWDNYYTSKNSKRKKSSYYYDDEDDYYGSYNSEKWNWGSYNTGFTTEDEDDSLFIKPHESYSTPKNYDIEAKLNFKANTKNNRDLIKEMARFFYYKLLEEKEYFHDKYADPDTLDEKDKGIYDHKKSYYDDLWDKEIPGYSPLEKALFVFSQVQDKVGPDKGTVTPKEMEQVIKTIKVNMEDYNDPVLNELLELNEFSKKKKFNILNKISMIKNLGSEFKIQKEIEERIVPNSQVIVKKLMRDFSQVYSADLYQRLMPDFPVKLLTKNLVVNVPIDRTEHKQKIIVLVDFSGSMADESKQEWVNALMIDRLRYCIKEEAELYFSYFVHRTSDLMFTHIHNRETAIKFWAGFSNHPNGGTTAIGTMVNYVKDQIDKKRLHNLNVDLSEEMPEILIVNDRMPVL